MQVRRWFAKNTEAALVISARKRAKALGLEFNLTASDVVVPAVCPVLGVPLVRGGIKGRNHAPSIDRMDPKQGYIRGNVRVISFRANALKSNATSAELEKVLADLRTLGL